MLDKCFECICEDYKVHAPSIDDIDRNVCFWQMTYFTCPYFMEHASEIYFSGSFLNERRQNTIMERALLFPYLKQTKIEEYWSFKEIRCHLKCMNSSSPNKWCFLKECYTSTRMEPFGCSFLNMNFSIILWRTVSFKRY